MLWHLVTYLWLVLPSPLLLRLYRKAGVPTILLPLAGLLALMMYPTTFGETAGWVLQNVLAYAPPTPCASSRSHCGRLTPFGAAGQGVPKKSIWVIDQGIRRHDSTLPVPVIPYGRRSRYGPSGALAPETLQE